MTTPTSFSSEKAYKVPYHNLDTRYNICSLPPNLDPSSRARIEQQARSVACLVKKDLLLKTSNNSSDQYSIQSPPVLTLASRVEADYRTGYKEHCLSTAKPYDEMQTQQRFEGNFAEELCLGEGTAFLIGKQLVLTAAHCVCDTLTGIKSSSKIANLMVIFGFQMQPSGQVHDTFDGKNVYHIDAVWNYSYKKGKCDWAIVKLDREVDERDLLTFATSPLVPVKTQLYMLGHPLGLPLKLTTGAEVKERTKPRRTDEIKNGDEPSLFEADLDAFVGNSGSPVFELESGSIIAMLFSGNTLQTKFDKKTIYFDQLPKQVIDEYGYEKCLKIASIDFLKTILSSSFKMGHTHFTGRTEHLAKLKAYLTGSFPSTRIYILYGPGGVGKSELAFTFANQNIEDFSFIWLIDCRTDEEQWIGYQGVAKQLEIYVEKKETLYSLINKVHRKLEQNKTKPWLLLFDNLQTPPDNPPVFPKLPCKGGSILITSYKSPTIYSLPKDAILATEVLPLEPEEALKFLEKMTEKSLTDCQKLLTHVGSYPLVLGQVASYLKHTNIEAEDYLANLKKHEASLATHGNLSKTPRVALEAAFNMTLQQLSLPAKKWLFLCSHLNAALIPLSYLKTWLDSEHISEEQGNTVEDLEKYALLRYNPQEEVFSLHLELQRILKSIAARDIGGEVARLIVNMGKEWSFNTTSNWEETMKKATIWASHAELCIKAAGEMLLDDRISILKDLGIWEYQRAHYDKALIYHDEGLKITRNAFGENHSNVRESLHNIGVCYSSQGNYTEALRMYGEALKLAKANLGENHPDIVEELNSIANCYLFQGNCTEGLEIHREVLELRKATLGEDHPEVAMSLNNLGLCYFEQGEFNDALQLFNSALEIYRLALGENNPTTMDILNNISNCYLSQGNYDRALKTYHEVLEIQMAILGKQHPSTAKSLDNIGLCYFRQGNFNEALKANSEALAILKSALGESHPDIAMCLQFIGMSYFSLGNLGEALKHFREALEINRITLGENHHTVADNLGGMGNCYCMQQNYSAAFKAHDQALKIKRKALGETHPDVAMSLVSIGACYFFQRNYIKAIEMYHEALNIFRNSFEETHPDVKATLNRIQTCRAHLNQQQQTCVLI